MNVPSLPSFARAATAAALLLAATGTAQAQGIRFEPCPENGDLQCGELVVPVDYDAPHGRRVGLAVVRAKAADPT